MNKVEATGATHEVKAEELFFSVTDDRGVITEANKVFVDLSRYELGDLIGAPHNVIRHPNMPGGAFHAMWNALKSGLPFGCYVQNLAQDGSRYDVYATVTPLPNGGYLSVRSRPMCVDVRDVVFEIYESTIEHEAHVKEEKANRREVAASGSDHLLELIKEAGFSSYAEFQNAILPMEVLAREAETTPLTMERTASGDLGELQDSVHGVFTELHEWMDGLEPLERLSMLLRRARRRLGRDIESAASIVDNLEDLKQDGSDTDYEQVLAPLKEWAEMRSDALGSIDHLHGQLEEFDEQIEQSRFTIALARLHTTMVAQFIDELAAMDTIDEAAQRGIRLLADALDVDILTMWETADKLTSLSDTVNTDIDNLVKQLEKPLEVMVDWREQKKEYKTGDLAELYQSVSSSTSGADAAIAELKKLAEEVSDVNAPSTDELMTHIERVRELASIKKDES